jgi:4-carboxymuconolactone decarboxylase
MPQRTRQEREWTKLKQTQGTAGERVLERIESISPDLARYAVEFVFGDMHSRSGLDLKSREIAAVAALTAMGNGSPKLRAHIHSALNAGCSESDVVEIMIEMAAFAGFPAALNGIQAAKEVFAERSALLLPESTQARKPARPSKSAKLQRRGHL